MGKTKETKKQICEYIVTDYIFNRDLTNSDEIERNLKILVDNDLALKITGTDLTLDDVSVYKVASLFMTKYNDSLKNHRRKIKEGWELDESKKCADDDERLVKLAKNCLDDGTYFAILDKEQYAAFKVSFDAKDHYDVDYEIYFIGTKKEKWKNKFFKFYKKYEIAKKEARRQRIYYSDGRPTSETKFKPFSQLIFHQKPEIMSYIDNFINNIPTYYKYGMTPKLSILLYGKPGTGKSTFCRALADYMDIPDIMALSPSYFTDAEDGNSRRCGRGGIRDTIYAIDDIDCVCVSRDDSDDMNNAKTMSNLLTFLDNPGTFYYEAKDGIRYPISVVVATTNYYDRLDDAVKRFGRFDLKIEMIDLDRSGAEEMCALYGLQLEDVEKDKIGKDYTISPAKLQALCMANIDQSIKKIK